MIQPWPKLGSKLLADYRIFTVRSDRKRSPRTQNEHDFFVIDCVNWVNIVALTPNDELVMVEQYRHGTNTVELEIPGGMMDPDEDSPLATGVRELREETGYVGDSVEMLGKVFPNPAIMSNTCNVVLIKNCRLEHATEFDSGEDLETKLVPLKDIPKLVTAGKIQHSLVVVALYYLDLKQRGF